MNWWTLVWLDLKAIVSDKAIAITLFGGVLFYSVLYPLPYLHQVPTRQAIVVVDLDRSSLSRELIRDANASPKLEVVGTVGAIPEAQRWITVGRDGVQAHGLLVIPEHFSRDIKLGKGATLAIGGNASYFLVYSTIAEGLVDVGMDFAAELKWQALTAHGSNPVAASMQLSPLDINAVPAFNLSLGYTPYMVPGLFLLILQQTLLVGTGILGAGQWRHQGYWSQVSPLMLLGCRVLAFMLIYGIFSAYYVGWCYYWYGANLTASVTEIGLLMLPFLLASSLAGIALSALFTRRELPTQIYLLSSMPMLFVSGFVWPLVLIPAPLVWLSQVFPVTPAIMGMLKMNQMGASWQQILPYWLQLWLLVVVFMPLAWRGIRYHRGRLDKASTQHGNCH
ncbi:MAG: ABC transporter permease [Shewanella sp.]|nr:ABC transporter permease [Shewanella sp.]MCF1429520.1 ABC transporter permease [Shewanella sp.]MCF1439120.1 ABC transporter permease [Shewanella sp.]MCF1457704.1 ABC transporter permease [Shewanella sp.]